MSSGIWPNAGKGSDALSIDFSGGDFSTEELEPLVTTSLTREDEGEYSLRPKTLKEYIGQEKAKGNLEVFTQACL